MADVSDGTDLTTLVGDNDRYRALVQAKFQSEFGNVTWGGARLSTKDEFLEEYGSKNAAVRSLLREWISHYGLEHGFKQRELIPPTPSPSELAEAVRSLKKLVLEGTMDDSRAVSYAEYYGDKVNQGRVELWQPELRDPDTPLPAFLRLATNHQGGEHEIVKPFWSHLLKDHRLFPRLQNAYEISHLGTKIPDIAFFPDGVSKPLDYQYVAAGDCKGSKWTGTSSSEKGQVMLYVHRILDSQPLRQFSYAFVTNNSKMVLVKGYRGEDPPFLVRWCVSGIIDFEHGMKLWLQVMQEDSGYRDPPSLRGYPIAFQEALRPGGTCRAYGATYKGMSVVAKLYANDEVARENAERTMTARQVVASVVGCLPLATVPTVVETEGRWSLISPKGISLKRENVTKQHIDRLVRTLKIIHDAGIIHRDVRVSNIFCLDSERILLNDWGSSVQADQQVLYAGAPEPHIHPAILPHVTNADVYVPAPEHDLYTLVSSIAQLLSPGVNNESRHETFGKAFKAAYARDYDGVRSNLTVHMKEY